MDRIQLIIGTYNHLNPSYGDVKLEATYQRSYRPFLSTLYRFPDLQATMHYSGALLLWLERNHPEFLMLLEEMVARKQIEFIGGGFFAPLLPLIPSGDRLGQIEMLTTYARKRFGKRPRGLWLQDFAWESSLVSSLSACGMDYTFLPIEAFPAWIGLDGHPDYAITEDQGKSAFVFPVQAHESLDDALPERILDVRRGSKLRCHLFSGEALTDTWLEAGGESPDVFYEAIFTAIQKAALSFETITPSRYLRSPFKPGKAYFPSIGSVELVTAARSKKGDHETLCPPINLRQVVLNDSNSSSIYAKMLYVHMLVSQLKGDKSRKKSALEELWQAQGGEAYWCPTEGGVEIPRLRLGAFENLIEAERLTRSHNGFAAGIVQADLDFDGSREILYQGNDFNAYLKLTGGCLVELDSLKKKRNFLAARSYAEASSYGASLEDVYKPCACFSDSIGADPAGDTWVSLMTTEYELLGLDRATCEASLVKEASISIGGASRAFSISKRFAFRKGGVDVHYSFAARGTEPFALAFALSHTVLLGEDPEDQRITARSEGVKSESAVLEPFSASRVDRASIEGSGGEALIFRSTKTFDLVALPVIHPSPMDGTTMTYQGSHIRQTISFSLDPDRTEEIVVSLDIKH